jgi:hypothetical protein
VRLDRLGERGQHIQAEPVRQLVVDQGDGGAALGDLRQGGGDGVGLTGPR